MRSIIKWSLSAKVLIVVIAAALVFFGSAAAQRYEGRYSSRVRTYDRRSPD